MATSPSSRRGDRRRGVLWRTGQRRVGAKSGKLSHDHYECFESARGCRGWSSRNRLLPAPRISSFQLAERNERRRRAVEASAGVINVSTTSAAHSLGARSRWAFAPYRVTTSSPARLRRVARLHRRATGCSGHGVRAPVGARVEMLTPVAVADGGLPSPRARAGVHSLMVTMRAGSAMCTELGHAGHDRSTRSRLRSTRFTICCAAVLPAW